MEVKVIEDRENKVLERREVHVRITSNGATAKRSEIRDRLIAVLNSSKDTLILDSIKTEFGTRESTAEVRIYQTKDKAFKTEPRYVLRKNFPDEIKEEPKKEAPKKDEKEQENQKKFK